MTYSTFVSLFFLAHSAVLVAATFRVCYSYPYSECVDLLEHYSPAESYCSAKYPLPTHTVTKKAARPTTLTVTVSPANDKRAAKTTQANNRAASCLSRLHTNTGSFAKTVCSCIETAPTTTVTITPTRTITTTASATCTYQYSPPDDSSAAYEVDCGRTYYNNSPGNNPTITTTTATDIYNCINVCDTTETACYAAFAHDTLVCTCAYDSGSGCPVIVPSEPNSNQDIAYISN